MKTMTMMMMTIMTTTTWLLVASLPRVSAVLQRCLFWQQQTRTTEGGREELQLALLELPRRHCYRRHRHWAGNDKH